MHFEYIDQLIILRKYKEAYIEIGQQQKKRVKPQDKLSKELYSLLKRAFEININDFLEKENMYSITDYKPRSEIEFEIRQSRINFCRTPIENSEISKSNIVLFVASREKYDLTYLNIKKYDGQITEKKNDYSGEIYHQPEIIFGYNDENNPVFDNVLKDLVWIIGNLEKKQNRKVKIFIPEPKTSVLPTYELFSQLITVKFITTFLVRFITDYNVNVEIIINAESGKFAKEGSAAVFDTMSKLLFSEKKHNKKVIIQPTPLTQMETFDYENELARELLTVDQEYLNEVLKLINSVNRGDNILLMGETGVGKTHLANLIHKYSNRKKETFTCIDSFSESGLDFTTQLSGSKKGAYTNSTEDIRGLLKESEDGIIFIDDFDNAPRAHMDVLLNLIKHKSYRVVGKPKSDYADVVFIFGTNNSFQQLLSRGVVENDFIYRINKTYYEIKPLRRRINDLPRILEYYIKSLNDKYDKDLFLAPDALPFCENNYWSGNIRMLESSLERIFSTSYSPNFISGKDIKNASGRMEAFEYKNIFNQLEDALWFLLKKWDDIVDNLPELELSYRNKKSNKNKAKNFLENLIIPIIAHLYYDVLNQDKDIKTKDIEAEIRIGVGGVNPSDSKLRKGQKIYDLVKKAIIE